MKLNNRDFYNEYGVLIVSSGGCGCSYLKINITLEKFKRKSKIFGVDDEVVSLYKKWDENIICGGNL